MPTNTTAADLKTGDYIIGDRAYAAGLLEFTVEALEATTFENGETLITVSVLAGPYAIERTISYRATDQVILGSANGKADLEDFRSRYQARVERRTS